MASRTRQKEEARQRRLAAEQARLERSRRERRLRMVGGTIVAAIAVVVVLIAISSGGGSKPAPKVNTPAATRVGQTVASLLAGIPQSGNRLGSPSAPVTVTEFGDLECPICQQFALNGQQTLIQNDVRAGKVKVLYRSMCTATCNGPGQQVFNTQQAAAVAAGFQNLEWYYVELFYHLQGQEGTGYVNASYLNGLARLVPGLNYSRWLSDRTSSSALGQVTNDINFANTNGIQPSTPTLIIAGPKGQTQPIQSELSYSDLEQVVKEVS